MPQSVGPFVQLTDHGRELPGMMDKVNVVYSHVEYYSAIKRNEILTPATTWINLEILRSKRSQT